MSPPHTILYLKNIIITLSMIDIFRFISCKRLKLATFHVHGLYSNFALFPFLHICVLYFNITSGSRGSLKGKKILLNEITYNLIHWISEEKKGQKQKQYNFFAKQILSYKLDT